jgi:hypothetical protein
VAFNFLTSLKQTILKSPLRAPALVASRAFKSMRVASEIFSPPPEGQPRSVIVLDFPVSPKPRFSPGHPNPFLVEILNRRRAEYRAWLERFLPYRSDFERIQLRSSDETEPTWINGCLPAFDAISLYCTVAEANPRTIVEVGSGNSSKFIRRAITDHHLRGRLISIDPWTPIPLERICDQVIRRPVEDLDQSIFDQLGHRDVLFIDGSHRALQNSDVTVLFLEVIPRLPPGVLVHFHDINLPYDYGSESVGLFYNEQYILAAYLLADGGHIRVLLPGLFVSYDEELKSILNPIWAIPHFAGIDRRGASFWFETT